MLRLCGSRNYHRSVSLCIPLQNGPRHSRVRSLFTCCAPPTTPFVCLPRASIPHFLYSQAACPHQQPTTSGESQNDKHDLRVSAFVDTACSLVHFRLILPLCAYLMLHLASSVHLNHILFASTESPKSSTTHSRFLSVDLYNVDYVVCVALM